MAPVVTTEILTFSAANRVIRRIHDSIDRSRGVNGVVSTPLVVYKLLVSHNIYYLKRFASHNFYQIFK